MALVTGGQLSDPLGPVTFTGMEAYAEFLPVSSGHMRGTRLRLLAGSLSIINMTAWDPDPPQLGRGSSQTEELETG